MAFDQDVTTDDNRQKLQEILAIISGSLSGEEMAEQLSDYHDNDIAEAMESLDPEQRKRLFDVLGDERTSDIFSYVEDEDVGTYVEEMGLERAADVLENMDVDDAVDVLEEIDEQTQKQLIGLIDEEARQDIQLIRSYDDDEIGSEMTTNFIVMDRGLTVKQAMKELVRQAKDNDNISTLYVNNEDGTFYGAIDLKDLIIAREYIDLEDIISTSYPYVRDHETIQDCLDRLVDYAEDSIPVLDGEDHILGVITAHDIVEAVDEELGDDYAKLAGLTAEEDLTEPLGKSMKKRLPWLIALMFLGILVSLVVGKFEAVVSQLAIIVSFQSLILDMAGNVGTQSLAVTIRVLMDEDLTFTDKLHLVFKELRVGFCNGLLLGLLSVCFVGVYLTVLGRTWDFAFSVSCCVGAALLCAMIISSVVGTLIPMFFHRIHVDPAIASGPLITTVNDLVAVIVYYGLAWIFLINMLHLGQ